jgi:hypothetical protein
MKTKMTAVFLLVAASISQAELLTFDFVDGSALDGGGLGASMTVTGATSSRTIIVNSLSGYDGQLGFDNSAIVNIPPEDGLAIDSLGNPNGSPRFEESYISNMESMSLSFDQSVYFRELVLEAVHIDFESQMYLRIGRGNWGPITISSGHPDDNGRIVRSGRWPILLLVSHISFSFHILSFREQPFQNSERNC